MTDKILFRVKQPRWVNTRARARNPAAAPGRIPIFDGERGGRRQSRRRPALHCLEDPFAGPQRGGACRIWAKRGRGGHVSSQRGRGHVPVRGAERARAAAMGGGLRWPFSRWRRRWPSGRRRLAPPATMLIEQVLEHFLGFYVVVLDQFSMNRAENRTQSGLGRGPRGRATATSVDAGKGVDGPAKKQTSTGRVTHEETHADFF